MTQEEFCNFANGKPWVNRAVGPDSYDCWGLVIASFRYVDGIKLPEFKGYCDYDCQTNDAYLSGDLSKFKQSQPCDGAIMTIFDKNGQLVHVGRCLAGRVLHATKGIGVKWDTYQSLKYRFLDVRYVNYCPE